MPNPRDIALLMDITTAGRHILAFTEGMDEASFVEDSRTHLAVQHQLLVIGEAAKRQSALLLSCGTNLVRFPGPLSHACGIG